MAASNLTLPYQLFLSFALGTAARPALEPFAQSLANEAWQVNASVPPDALYLAQGVAQGKVTDEDAYLWAKEQGYGPAQMDAMVAIATNGPALGYAFQAWRRGTLTDKQFERVLERTGLDAEWFYPLYELKHDRLDLGALATAVHRGIVDDAGLLVVTVPSGSGNVPRIPVSTLDTLAEFASHGIDPERARVLVADTGLPLSLGEMLALYNRGKVTETDVKVSIAESNLRNEYMDVALDLARRLLTPHEYAEAELRGVLTHDEALAGARLSGIDPGDYPTLFSIMGRPLNVHEITTGLARGGTFGGTYDDVPEPYRDAIRRSAIRPEYAVLAHANRFSYPSAFVLRSLAEAGDLGTTADVEQLLLEIAWPPPLAKKVSAKWVPVGATTDPHITKARTQLWTATHGSYVKGEIGAADAQAALPTAGVDAASVSGVLAVWDAERALIRKQLSVAQIKKAVADAVVNAATGLAWTVADAIAALTDRGYSQADAQTIMTEA